MQTTNQALDQLLYAIIAVMRRKGGTTISVENAREIIHDMDEDVVHPGIVSRSQKIPEFRPILEFATDRWLAERESHGGIFTVKQRRVGKRITQFAIYTVDQQNQDETDQDMPPPQAPLLCIEVIRDERFSDSNSKRAYTITKADGLREFRGGILQITNPPLEMDLRTIFD